MDAEDSTKFNELDKNVAVRLKFLRKIHIFVFAVVIFWLFSENIKILVPRIPFSFFDPFMCASPTPEEPNNTIFPKIESGMFSGEFGGKAGWVGLIDFQMTLWDPKK